MSVVISSIPKRIAYVARAPENICVGCEWDFKHDGSKPLNQEKVIPVFPTDADNKNTLETAKKWSYNTSDNNIFVTDNNVIERIRILKIEERANGGRSWKSLVFLNNSNYLIDLREDVVIDAMLNCGIQKNGIIEADFIWVKVGSQMKLIRKDSELYNLVSKYHAKTELKPISKNDLEVGGIYINKKEDKYLFLGLVDTDYYKYDESKEPKLSNTKLNKQMLFFTPSSYDYDNDIKEIKSGALSQWWKYQANLIILNSHSLIEKISNIEIDNKFIINKLRNNLYELTKARMTDNLRRNLNAKDMITNLKCEFAYMSKIRNMRLDKESFKTIDLEHFKGLVLMS